MRIPLLDLRRGGAELDAELEAAFARVLRSGVYILGPEVEAFERECAAQLGVEHAIGVSSGTDALLVVLMALGVGPGDEVVCPTYTFFATAGAVARLGARPVFVDSDESFDLDPAKLDRAIGPHTKAILPVHLFGQLCDMRAIGDAASRRGVPVVEDAAQAIGAERDGLRAGATGAAGCFSFFPSKNLGALGDAGLVTTNDTALAKRVRSLRVHGGEPKYFHELVGGNFRLDALQAALLRVKLPRLQTAIEARRAHARAYSEALATLDGVAVPPAFGRHVFHQYVVRLRDEAARDRAQRILREQGIGTAVYYPLPLHMQRCFSELGHGAGDFPVAERLARTSLALPMFPELTAEERAAVVEALAAAVR